MAKKTNATNLPATCRRGRWRGYWMHAALLVALLLQVGLARRSHLTTQRLDELSRTGDSRQKAYAHYVLANRGQPRDYEELIIPLLRGDDVLLRELMMTTSFGRFKNKPLRRQFIRTLTDETAAFRCRFLFETRVGNFTPMKLAELERFLALGPD